MPQYQIIRDQEGSITINPKNHRHTLIWLHGLACSPQSNLNAIIQSLSLNICQVKVIIPKAPLRFVTLMKKQVLSWFDIKFRGQKSFTVPFDQAFSTLEVFDSFQKILEPLINTQRQLLKKNENKGLLIVAGFSQGCGMALHCLYHSKNVDAVLGIAGYLFPITKFDQNLKNKKKIIYGLADKLRPWQYTKITYQGKIGLQQIVLVEDMAHDLRPDTIKQMKKFFNQVLNLQNKASL